MTKTKNTDKKRDKTPSHKEQHGEFGKVYFSWDFPEYNTSWRNNSWYKWAIPVALVLVAYAFFTGNYLFAVIIVLFGIIYFFQSFDNPLTVRCEITEDGIVLGARFYDYRDLSLFWIIYEPPEVKNLYIEFRNSLKPRIGIPLGDQNPLAIREVLAQYLDEETERENEPISDGLSRVFRMH